MLKNIISGFLVATLAVAGSAMAQGKQIKIGVIFDMSGALAAGGSNASYLGTKYAIDIINERGGVEGYKIVPIYVDAQSKTEVAINETERLVIKKKLMSSWACSLLHSVFLWLNALTKLRSLCGPMFVFHLRFLKIRI